MKSSIYPFCIFFLNVPIFFFLLHLLIHDNHLARRFYFLFFRPMIPCHHFSRRFHFLFFHPMIPCHHLSHFLFFHPMIPCHHLHRQFLRPNTRTYLFLQTFPEKLNPI